MYVANYVFSTMDQFVGVLPRVAPGSGGEQQWRAQVYRPDPGDPGDPGWTPPDPFFPDIPISGPSGGTTLGGTVAKPIVTRDWRQR